MSDKVPMSCEEWLKTYTDPNVDYISLSSAYEAGQNSMREDRDRLVAELAELNSLPKEWEGSGYSPQQCARIVKLYWARTSEYTALIEQCRALAEELKANYPISSDMDHSYALVANAFQWCADQFLALLPESAKVDRQ